MSGSHRIGLGSIASVALLISLVAARHARSEHGASNVPPAAAPHTDRSHHLGRLFREGRQQR